MNKSTIIEQIIAQLTAELHVAETAANQAHLAATDDQSIAETQYDTLAIEAGYLAQGQSQRASEIKADINQLKAILVTEGKSGKKVSIASLVQLEKEQKQNNFLFISPAAGGYKCQVFNSHKQECHITLVTPRSPMGSALLGKELDDEVSLTIGNNIINDFITFIQ